jgi:hypothetical protein
MKANFESRSELRMLSEIEQNEARLDDLRRSQEEIGAMRAECKRMLAEIEQVRAEQQFLRGRLSVLSDLAKSLNA